MFVQIVEADIMTTEDGGDKRGKVCLANDIDLSLIGETEVVSGEESPVDGVDLLGVVEQGLEGSVCLTGI